MTYLAEIYSLLIGKKPRKFQIFLIRELFFKGMNGHEVLSKVEKGYRMPKPTGGIIPCPDPYYDIMLQCWKRNADSRPTFEYLRDFFDNYFVSSEGQYSGEPMG